MARADTNMLMEMSTKECGKMIWHMVRVSTLAPMDPLTLVTGIMICSTALEEKLGPISLVIPVTTTKERSMERESIFMQTAQFMKVIGAIIKFMGKASTLGKMERSTMESGRTEIWMAKVLSLGLMVAGTRVSIRTTKSMDSVFMFGRMVVSTLASGKMGNSTARASIEMSPDLNVKAFGSMERELPG